MAHHVIKEIDRLKRKIMNLSGIVEERLHKAVKALEDKDATLAQSVIASDFEIDDMEVEVEEECLKILALYQPVAADLRLIIAILKINNDLERIGDLAVNVAERVSYIINQPQPAVHLRFQEMATMVESMLRRSLDSLVNLDVMLASEVCNDDDVVDGFNRDMIIAIRKGIAENPKDLDVLFHCLSISRHLERIADQATNIAEDVIYMATGEIVRHKSEDFNSSQQ